MCTSSTVMLVPRRTVRAHYPRGGTVRRQRLWLAQAWLPMRRGLWQACSTSCALFIFQTTATFLQSVPQSPQHVCLLLPWHFTFLGKKKKGNVVMFKKDWFLSFPSSIRNIPASVRLKCQCECLLMCVSLYQKGASCCYLIEKWIIIHPKEMFTPIFYCSLLPGGDYSNSAVRRFAFRKKYCELQ